VSADGVVAPGGPPRSGNGKSEVDFDVPAKRHQGLDQGSLAEAIARGEIDAHSWKRVVSGRLWAPAGSLLDLR
jgi:hypothetical protein